nr:hypothetical protein [Actinomycetota bacterium]
MNVHEVYDLLAARLPHHAGSSVTGLTPSPVSAFGDQAWLREHVALTGRLYGSADDIVAGTVFWYSSSSMLLAPTIESILATGTALDPASVSLYVRADGRLLGARAATVCPDPADRLRAVIESCVGSIAAETGAHTRSLWTIASDSLANRVLWAGGLPADAVTLASAVGVELPVPRFVEVGGQPVVRRSSCCLIYE